MKMATFKVVELIAGLSRPQMADLDLFLLSSKSKCGPRELNLYRGICSLNPKLPITSTELSQRLKINKNRLADTANKLLPQVANFCIQESLNDNQNRIDRLKGHLDFLIASGLTDQYVAVLKAYEEEVQFQKLIFPGEYLSAYRLYKSIAVHEKLLQGRKISVSISSLKQYLEAYYRVERIKLLCESISRSNVLASQNDVSSYDQIIAEAKKVAPYNPILPIYKTLIGIFTGRLSLTSDSYDALYEKVLKLPLENSPHPEVVTIFHLLINLAITGNKSGLPLFRSKYLILVDHLIQSNLLLERNIISMPLFKTTIKFLLDESNYEGASEFLKRFSPHLSPNIRKDATAFSKAQIAFANGDYKETRANIDSIHRPSLDAYFALNIRKLEVQLFIEEYFKPERGFKGKRDADRFQQLIRNFKLFLKRSPRKTMDTVSGGNMISTKNKKAAWGFIVLVSKIVVNNSNQEMLNKIALETKQRKELAERDWLFNLVKGKR